jgi:ribosomal protein L19
MTRLPRPRRESAGQGLLFDDDVTERVLRDARDPGFVLVGISESVHTRHIGTRAAEHAIPVRPDVAATVHHLLAAGRLAHGSRVTVTVDGRAEPEAATIVDLPAVAATEAQPGDRVRVFVDVVRPGHGLVTADEFSGAIVRENGSYLVETSAGDVIGRARSYRAGAERLARHHGFRADPVEIEHEHEVYPR